MVRLRSPAPYLGDFPSGQRGQTVNLLSLTSVVRIHHPPPEKKPSRKTWLFSTKCSANTEREVSFGREAHFVREVSCGTRGSGTRTSRISRRRCASLGRKPKLHCGRAATSHSFSQNAICYQSSIKCSANTEREVSFGREAHFVREVSCGTRGSGTRNFTHKP